MKKISLTENELKDIIKESVKGALYEAENGGWVVDESMVDDAYKLFVRHYGEENTNEAIVRTLSSNQLADSLAYIFRMYDFEEWNRYANEEATWSEVYDPDYINYVENDFY